MLTNLLLIVFVFATKRCTWDVQRIKLINFLVIKAEPRVVAFARGRFSVLDEAVVVACIGSARVNNDAFELELVVRLADLSIQDNLLILSEIIDGKAFLVHFLE